MNRNGIGCLAVLLAGQVIGAEGPQQPPLPPSFTASPPVPSQPAAPGPVAPRPVPQLPPPPIVMPRPVYTPPPQLTELAFDSVMKQATGNLGDTNVGLTFSLTNISPHEVSIIGVRTSCGCTVASLPARPWRLPPGTNGQIGVRVDVRGKYGVLTKSVFIDALVGTNTSQLVKTLVVQVNMPMPAPTVVAMSDRERNMRQATADRQIVFKNDCAKCHAEPAAGKSGEALYVVACGICHDSPHRATMVPDLRALNHPTDAAHWKQWTSFGKPGTLMPAFAKSEGGPLTDEQIGSLVDYLVKTIPSRPATNTTAKAQGATVLPGPAQVLRTIPTRPGGSGSGPQPSNPAGQPSP